MQLFMRGVSFRDKEDDLNTALAAIFHRPPFPVQKKINFHVRLFYQKGGLTHRGMGLLTLPSPNVANMFLTMYPRGLPISRRTVNFSPSNRDPDQALIQRVATSEWEDPLQLRIEQQRIADESAPIYLSRASFGRFCAGGVFSPEVHVQDTQARVICDIEDRQLQLKVSPPDIDLDGVPPQFGSLSELLDGTSYSACYNASSIVSIAVSLSPGAACVFIEATHPPTFIREVENMLEHRLDLSGKPPPRTRQRLASLYGQEELPPVARGLCLTFCSEPHLRTFTRRLGNLRLPHPVTRVIVVEPRNLYDPCVLNELDTCLQSLPFPLAFEIEKAVLSGILAPPDIVYDLMAEVNRLNEEEPENVTAIFKSFVLSLDNLGIEAFPVSRRARSCRRKRTNPIGRTLAQKLADEAIVYMSRQYQPRGRLSMNGASANTGLYQAYHLIITPTGRLLDGPLPDQSNSVLRRFGNHECFLRVTFQDETGSKPRRDPNLLIDELLNEHYKPILVHGVKVAGRQYEFLGYSMSGLKDYAFGFVRPFAFDGVYMDATEIRDSLGDFSRIQHHPALLAARWSQAFSASDPSVSLDPESIHRIRDLEALDNSCFTDGVGTLSPQLAREVATALQRQRRFSKRSGNPPSAYQFRLGGAKGVLVVDPRLDGRVVCLRNSQLKFEGTGRSLDISNTSARPIAVFLNRSLITLLEYHGISRSYIQELQTVAVDEVYSILQSLDSASAILAQHGLGSPFRLPSLLKDIYSILHLNIEHYHGLDHQLIVTCLHYATTHLLREIKHRAHILVPGSYTLIGVADEWDCLNEGEIYATVVDERTGLRKAITGRVLITRSPQIHPGDLQMVTAVSRPELEHLTNVVVFACRGRRSLPSMLGGGDLDGDIYNLILDPSLHPPRGHTEEAGDYTPLDRRKTEHPCTVKDVADFVIDYIKTDLLGYISILHLRHSDLQDPSCRECLQLAESASCAVDFPKTGTPVNLQGLPRPPSEIKPDFLSGEGVNPARGSTYYPSIKLLGQLYRNVPNEEYHPNPERRHFTDGSRIVEAIGHAELHRLGLPSIDDPLDENLLSEMGEILEEYSTQLHHIAKAHTTSKRASDYLSEAELVSGTIQEKWTDPRRRREAVSSMNMQVKLPEFWIVDDTGSVVIQTRELTLAIGQEFRGAAPAGRTHEGSDVDDGDGDEDDYEDFGDYDGFFSDQERDRQTFTRAFAAWTVAEEALNDDHSAFGPSSFGLLALGMMLRVIQARRKAYL